MASRSAALAVRAGPAALRHLEQHGLQAGDIRMMVGASGGAKWLSLIGLDHAILRRIVPGLENGTHLLGSSIGTWRFACYTQPDPLSALNRFEHGYIEQTYSQRPDTDEITAVGRQMVARMLGEGGIANAVNSERFRLHIMAVQAHGWVASERRVPLLLGLTAAMLANRIDRRRLARFFSRACVSDARADAPFHAAKDFPMQRIALTEENLVDAILASSAIPLVLNGVRNLAGARDGVYRDGGIIDYHFDLPMSFESGLTLYPHFYPDLTPGWFDKKLKRRPRAEHIDRVLLLAPSPQFVANLPGGKIPDRTDFTSMDASTRIRVWREVVAETERLGEAFEDLLDRQAFAAVAEPLEAA
ncbi:MAG: patatin-like phospholipase family protein [Pseudomonadota bacterium]